MIGFQQQSELGLSICFTVVFGQRLTIGLEPMRALVFPFKNSINFKVLLKFLYFFMKTKIGTQKMELTPA